MITFLNFRMNLLFTATLLVLAACGQQDTGDTGILEADAYLGVAEIYRGQGQFRAAVIESQNALQAAPDYAKTKRFISRVYLDMGDSGPAEEILEAYLSQEPTDVEAILLLAEAKINSGNQVEALSLLEDLQLSNPTQINMLHWLRGNAYIQSNNTIAAQESLLAALEADPSNLKTLISLSMLEYQGGNEFGAQQYLDQALDINPLDLDLWIWRGQFAMLQQDYPAAEEAYFAALEIMGNYDIMTAKRFSVLNAILVPLQMQQKDQEALRYSQLIAETPQGQMQNTFNSAISMFQSGNFAEAEQTLNTILSSAPNHPGSNILLGMTAYAQGDFAAASESLAGLVSASTSSPEVIKTLAASHIRLNQPERALSVLEEAQAVYPDDASLVAMVAVSQQSLGQLEESIETFNRAIEMQGDSADIRFALARSYFLNGEREATIEQLNEVLNLNPNYLPAKSALIDSYIAVQDYDQALNLANEWLSAEPTSPPIINLLGRVQFTQGNAQLAKTTFQTSLDAEPENIEALLYLARINTADQQYSDAAENFSAIIAIQPGNLEALSGLLALGDLNDSVDSSIAQLRGIIASNPQEFTPPLVLAQYFLFKENFDDALPLAEVAYELNVNTYTTNTVLEIVFRKVAFATEDEDFDTAREFYEYALQLQPENLQSLILAANVETQAGGFDAAANLIERIRELQPVGSSLGTEVEGDLYVQREDLESALNSYQVAWAVAPTSSVAFKAHRTFNSLERSDEADAFLQEWITTLPNDPAANLLVGLGAQQNNDNVAAIGNYETTLTRQPDNVVALNNLAWLYQDDQPQRALELAARAAELAPENADVLDTYGWILLNQNNKELAVSVLEKAVELAPDSAAISDHLDAARQL